MNLLARILIAWTLLVCGLGAPAFAQSPEVPVLAQPDPCPGATLCGDFTKSAFKGFGVITPRFQGLPNLTATRASGAYGENPDGSLVWFQAGQARATAKGLGVFEATTNLLTWSQAFSNAAWNKSAVTVTDNQTAAPDGTITAAFILPNTSVAEHFVSQAGAVTAASYEPTLYAKAASYTKVGWREATTSGAYCTWDLNGPKLISQSGATCGTPIQGANGWYRLPVTYTGAATSQVQSLYVLPTAYTSGDPHSFTSAGDGVSGAYFWGADLRLGAYPVPYCPTAAGAATCAADQNAISGLTAASAVTFLEEALLTRSTAGPNAEVFGGLDDGTSSNRLQFFRTANASTFDSRLLVAGVATSPAVTTFSAQAATHRVGMSVLAGSALTSLDGVTGGATSPAGVPAYTTLHLGTNETASLPLNAYITRFAVYPAAVSQGVLNAWTSGVDPSSLSLNFAAGLYKTTTPYVRTNLIPNSASIGAVIGTLGAGGALPTGWVMSQTPTGTSVAVTGMGTDTATGLPYVDVRFFGTPSNTQQWLINPAGPTVTAQPYTLSVYAKIVSGSNASGLFLGGTNTNITSASASPAAMTRLFGSATATAGTAVPWAQVSTNGSGVPVDVTIRFAGWQYEATSYPTSAILTTGAAQSVATTQSTNLADVAALSYTGPAGYAPDCNGKLVAFAANNPRITCAGVLIEQAATNVVYPATPPATVATGYVLNNWGRDAGVTWMPANATGPDGAALSAGTVSMPAGGSTSQSFGYALTGTAAAWSGGFWAKGVAGQQVYVYLDTGGGASKTLVTFTGQWQRIGPTSQTLTAATNFLYLDTKDRLGSAHLPAVTFQLWKGQAELGSFLTSQIDTTSASVTRPADAMSYGGLAFSPTTLSLAAAGSSTAQAVIARIASLTDGTNNLDVDANGGATGYVTGNTLTGGGASVGPSVTAGLPVTVAVSLNSGAVHGSGNGQAATTLAGTQTMGTITTLRVGDLYTSGRPLNGTVQQIRIYPYAANDNELTYRSAGNF